MSQNFVFAIIVLVVFVVAFLLGCIVSIAIWKRRHNAGDLVINPESENGYLEARFTMPLGKIAKTPWITLHVGVAILNDLDDAIEQ